MTNKTENKTAKKIREIGTAAITTTGIAVAVLAKEESTKLRAIVAVTTALLTNRNTKEKFKQ